mgnify:CR=1 FL=1
MNKKVIVISFFLLFFSFLFAEKIVIAPIVTYDVKGYKIKEKKEPYEILYEKLHSFWFEGLLKFEMIKKDEFEEVLTVLDAEKVCNVKNEGYLLYGYIQKNDTSWYGNIKLYSTAHKKIIKDFFASDELLQYERFIEVLSENILFGIMEVLGIEERRKKTQEMSVFKIDLPISVFYWNPLDNYWSDVYTGIVGGSIGLEFFPPQKNIEMNLFRLKLSGKLDFEYAFAKGKTNNYPLNLHTLKIISLFIMRFDLDKIHTICLGIGSFYEIDFLLVREKYKSETFYFQNMFGLSFPIRYEFSMNEKVSLGAGIGLDFHLSENSYVSIKPQVLFVFNLL